MRQTPLISVLLAAAGATAWGQTQVDLRTQSKSIDFSAFGVTKPMSTGNTLPATCTAGQMYLLSNAAPGSNLYACLSANLWALEGGGANTTLPSVTGNGGDVLSTDGTNLLWSALGGDVSGTPAAETVVAIQGRPVAATVPGNGQTLVWNATAGQWQPAAAAGGATMASQLQDLTPAVSGGTMTLGQGCSMATPCNFRFGSDVYGITAPATAAITAGGGTAYVYVLSNGTLAVGSTFAVTCTAVCSAQSGVTAFPAGSIPLFTVTATGGLWNATGITDYRAFLSAKNVNGGLGVVSVDSGGSAAVSVDTSVVSTRVAVPATSTSACSVYTWATDGAYYYLCTAANQWMRVALSSW